jgi:hypothetical protein
MSFSNDKNNPGEVNNTAEEVRLSYANPAYESITKKNIRAQEYYTMLMYFI